MTGPTHIAVAISGTLVALPLIGFSPTAVGWLAVVIGSLAPDIDSRHATISRPGTLLERIIPRALKQTLNACGKLLAWICSGLFGHRNALHWPIIGLLISASGAWLEMWWLFWFGWGYLWHIAADFSTKSGVPIFGPFWSKDIAWSPLRTGSWQERVLASVLWLYVGWACLKYLPADNQLQLEQLLAALKFG